MSGFATWTLLRWGMTPKRPCWSRSRASSPSTRRRRSPSATAEVGSSVRAPERSFTGWCPTAIVACPGVRAAPPTWRSASPRLTLCARFSTTSWPRATRCAAFAAGFTKTASPVRPGTRPGQSPASARCWATRPTPAVPATTGIRHCHPLPAGEVRVIGSVLRRNGSRSLSPPSSARRCSRLPRGSPATTHISVLGAASPISGSCGGWWCAATAESRPIVKAPLGPAVASFATTSATGAGHLKPVGPNAPVRNRALGLRNWTRWFGSTSARHCCSPSSY